MSGIINSAGSRSGVIGTTELDYEEGTWTGAIAVGGGTVAQEWYTKIGNIVHGGFIVSFDATGGGGTEYVTGLPFTRTAGDFNIGCYVGFNTSGLAIFAGIAASATQVGYYSWSGTALSAEDLKSKRVDMSFTYPAL